MTKRAILAVLMGLMLCAIALGVPVNKGDKMEITIKLKVPDAGWKISIDEIYQVKNELWVISNLRRPPMTAAQVISTASDTVKVDTPDLPFKYYVLGKRWGWENEEPYIFLKSREEIEAQLKTATLIYEKPKKKKK